MTEEDYILVTDLARLRAVNDILRDCLSDKAKEANMIVNEEIDRMYEKIDRDGFIETE